MVPIIVATHGTLALQLVKTAEAILGAQTGLTAIGLEAHEGIEDLQRKFQSVLPLAGGCLILVDIFGGTPCNVSLGLAQTRRLQVLTGVNLPMLVEALTHRSEEDLEALAEQVRAKGQKSILNAGDFLRQSRGSGRPC